MIKQFIQSRMHNGEKYNFFAIKPSYKGEKGICGIEIEPYIKVETPPNCFGYTDTILLSDNGNAYPLNRPIQNWILKRIEKQMKALTEKL